MNFVTAADVSDEQPASIILVYMCKVSGPDKLVLAVVVVVKLLQVARVCVREHLKNSDAFPCPIICSLSWECASVILFLRGSVGHIYVYGPLLWPSGQSSWLQNQKSGFDFQCYQIFWEVVGLRRGPLSLVITIEKLLGINSSGFGVEE
jgi:hypothetical protein